MTARASRLAMGSVSRRWTSGSKPYDSRCNLVPAALVPLASTTHRRGSRATRLGQRVHDDDDDNPLTKHHIMMIEQTARPCGGLYCCIHDGDAIGTSASSSSSSSSHAANMGHDDDAAAAVWCIGASIRQRRRQCAGRRCCDGCRYRSAPRCCESPNGSRCP